MATQQSREALQFANRTRYERLKVKRAVKRNRKVLISILNDPPYCLRNMTIRELLLAQVRWGNRRVNTVLLQCHISHARTFATITPRECDTLRQALKL